MPTKDFTDRCRRDGHAELAALAHDAQVAPARALPGQSQDEVDDPFVKGFRTGAAAVRVGPRPGDEAPVPAAWQA